MDVRNLQLKMDPIASLPYIDSHLQVWLSSCFGVPACVSIVVIVMVIVTQLC